MASNAVNPVGHKRLGDLLQDEGLVSEPELLEAMAIQTSEGGFLGQILVCLGYVTQEAVASCVVKQCKIPHLSLMDYDVGPDVLGLVPREICEQHNLIPIDKLGRILTVAMVDPLDVVALEDVRAVCPELRIKPILCNWDDYDVVSRRVFAENGKKKDGGAVTADSFGLDPAPVVSKAKPKVAMAKVKVAPAKAASAETGGGGASDALVVAMRETMEANQTAQAEQSGRLASIAEAMLASVKLTSRLAETNAVKEGIQQDLTKGINKAAGGISAVGQIGESAVDLVERVMSEADEAVFQAMGSEALRETLIFDNFFPGGTNEFTFKLARAVSVSPGENYNPFFMYGNVGVGKTHLVSAVGNEILAVSTKKGAALRVGYVSASHFSKKLAEAIKAENLRLFRESYCRWDVLILDDIQFMGGRVEAQEEFFHIFNVLHEQGRQIIIVSDKAPDRLGLLEERLVSRFAGGIVAELKAPEWDTRMEILRQEGPRRGETALSEEILALIATRVPGDIRKMRGALNKLLSYANLVGKDVSREMADNILSHLGAEEAV